MERQTGRDNRVEQVGKTLKRAANAFIATLDSNPRLIFGDKSRRLSRRQTVNTFSTPPREIMRAVRARTRGALARSLART